MEEIVKIVIALSLMTFLIFIAQIWVLKLENWFKNEYAKVAVTFFNMILVSAIGIGVMVLIKHFC